MVVKIGTCRIAQRFTVARNFPDIVLLGLEAQESHDINVRPGSRLVSLKGVVTPYAHRPEMLKGSIFPLAPQPLNNVKLARTVVIPARSRRRVQVKIEGMSNAESVWKLTQSTSGIDTV